MSSLKWLIAVCAILSLSSCATQLTRGEKYATMYNQQPRSIAVMPPINETNSADAKDYFYTTLALPLINKGYYVFSPYLTMEMFQNEGAYDSEMFIDGDLTPFKNILNCDAVMFTRIKKWSKQAVGGVIKVDVEYTLRSTDTGDIIYQNEGDIKLDTSVNSGGGSLLGALIDMAATAINTAVTDKVVAGRACNQHVLSDMPEGPYSPMYQQDQGLSAWKGIVKGTVKAN